MRIFRFSGVLAAVFAALPGTVAAHDPSNRHLAAEAPGVDLTHLPLGDTKLADRPRAGSIWACGPAPQEAGGARVRGPWFNNDGTFDFLNKAVIRGQVTWPSRFAISIEGDKRIFSSNDLPNHPTGIFPVAQDDPAYAVDKNPNAIQAQDMRIEVPLNPVVAPKASCVPGAAGIMLTGVALFDALDAELRDAVAHEVQDGCQGHPQITGAYHYHSLSSCLEDKRGADGHSALMAYAVDGFGIFGHRGEGGKVLTNADLDECHGHTHKITWDGRVVEMYHYHATWEFPYTVGCLRGTFKIGLARVLSGATGRDPFEDAAGKLGISVDALREALGPPPPDFAGAAKKLGISEETLRAAIPRPQNGMGGMRMGRPPGPGSMGPGGMRPPPGMGPPP